MMDDTDADAVDLYEELGLSDWPDVLDREVALDSIGAFYHIVDPDSDDVVQTITSDFENEVKSHLEPAWAAAFMQDRGPYGRCMAKTITKDDGTQIVIADVHLFLKDAPSPEQTFRHEALHVLIHRRGESLNRSRDTIANHDGMHPDVVALAGIAAEEYRVDRCVMPSWDELWSSFEALCIAGHDAIRQAAVAYFYDHDVQANLGHRYARLRASDGAGSLRSRVDRCGRARHPEPEERRARCGARGGSERAGEGWLVADG